MVDGAAKQERFGALERGQSSPAVARYPGLVRLGIACAWLALPISAATAQTVRAPAPAAATVASWAGFYLGAGAGYGATAFNEATYSFDAQFSGTQPRAGQGAFATLLAGYDWQFASRFVLGAMIDVDFGGPEARNDFSGFGVPGPFHFKREGAWSAGVRFGVLMTPDTLVYVPVGFRQARFSWEDAYFSFMSQPIGRSATTQGWFAGLGLETRIGGNWTLRGEYRYAAFGDVCAGSRTFQTTSICQGTQPTFGITRIEDLVEQSFRVAVAYRFPTGAPLDTTGFGATAGLRNWTGFYLGGGVGGGSQHMSNRSYDYLTGSYQTSVDLGGRGVLGTILAGYDHKFAPHWVAGVFADGEWSNIGSRQVQNNGINSSSGSFTRDRAVSAGARLGWLAMPDTLLYVPVGYTQSHYSWDGSFHSFSPVDKKTFDASLGGIFAGFGIETMFADHWSLRGEYRYAWLSGNVCGGSTVVQVTPICKGVNDGVDYVLRTENFREQTVRAVVSYRFN
ncbi:outer membrane protein [Bradyrhizobium arachidis]|uniref:outer membrane protein n=1 Tax=Bradyrhizobium arachidis TaxID=858423 RepID=UPI002161A63F|nr:outer membrane beta-barrel protein [Bradyrhizobium arachidis]UVO31908.1 outer membrane beta-barrel protein [Bradyrhizobium arachidis]